MTLQCGRTIRRKRKRERKKSRQRFPLTDEKHVVAHLVSDLQRKKRREREGKIQLKGVVY